MIARPLALSLFLVAIIAISGCIGSSNEDTNQIGFIGGDRGLTLAFLDLPDILFQNTSFDIEIVVDNLGEYVIPAYNATFILNNADAFGISEENMTKTNLFDLSKATEQGRFGDREFIIYKDARYADPILTPESPIALSVEACYPYQTTAVADVCVAASSFSDICNTKEDKKVSNSGSPVQVSAIEQLLSIQTKPEEIRLGVFIEVEAKDEGVFYTSDTACDSLEYARTNSQNDRVTIEDIRIGRFSIGSDKIKKACGTDEVYLDSEGYGKIRCNLPLTGVVRGQGDYVERMSIVLGYTHTKITNNQISIIPA